jgi:signal transduction histidine kinase/PAS domain-containing protein
MTTRPIRCRSQLTIDPPLRINSVLGSPGAGQLHFSLRRHIEEGHMSRRHKAKREAPRAHDTVHDYPTGVSQRSPAQLAPSLHEALLQLLAEESPAIFWATDPELQLTACSGRNLLATDKKADQVFWTHLFDHIRSEGVEALLTAHQQAIAGKNSSCEVRCSAATYWVHVRPVPAAESPITGCIGAAIDITATRRAQEALVLRERLLGLIGEVGEALAGEGPTREILQRSMSVLARRMDSAFGRIWTLNQTENMLELLASGGEYTRLEGRYARVAVGRLRIGLIAETGHSYLTSDLSHDERIEDREWALREGISSFAGCPLVADGQVTGVLAVFGRKPLEQGVLDELAAVAGNIAQFVQRRRSEQERSLLLEREREARSRTAETVRRSAFLAQASLALDSSLDYKATLERVARLAVPTLADWCVVDVLEEGGLLHRCAAAAELVKQELLDELNQRFPTTHHPCQPTANVLQMGDALLFAECSDVATLLGPPRDADHQRLLSALESRSLMTVPLRARGQLFGAITLVSTSPEKRYDSSDLALAGDFARRCALAVDNARLLECAQREIAERRWAEETLLKSEEHLRQASKMEAMGRLAGNVAHDFNNVLMAIQGYAELLQKQLPAPEPVKKIALEIQRAGERGAQLTRQLLTFSRKEKGQSEEVNLNRLLENLQGMLHRLLREDIQVRIVHEPVLGSIQAEPGQIEQVVVNLVVNARDAMPRGGSLTIETRNVEVDASWSQLDVRPGPYVLLIVSDSGLGMTEEVRSHLFEPFFTTKAPGEGTGLGLAIVYGIVRQASGHIAVDSEPGQGATFRVYLPRLHPRGAEVRPAQQEREEPVAAVLPAGTAETVLLAEDDEVIRGMVARTLRTVGYSVLEARDGSEALRVAAGHSGTIDLLVTDVLMPRLGGREMAERLLESRPGVRVLYMSGFTDTVAISQEIEGGGSHLLSKPFTPQVLVRRVREVLEAG